MLITVNGKESEIAGEITIAQLIAEKGLDPDTIVIEHNLVIVKKDAWANTTLKNGDTLEIVSFVGGG